VDDSACIPALRFGSGHVLTSDEEAEFAALVGRQARLAFRVAYAVLLNSADAEDAVQETFLKLHRHGGWRQAESERAFVARVAWRTAVDLRRSAQPAFFSEPVGCESLVDPPSSAPGPEETVLMANQEALVHRMIDALPEDLRLPLVLSSSQELNSREIGEVLGIPEGTVRTRLQRARLMLRQKLEASLVRRKETLHD
jgi:RNA polymerase sigma-70 factor (ECF subfamily)